MQKHIWMIIQILLQGRSCRIKSYISGEPNREWFDKMCAKYPELKIDLFWYDHCNCVPMGFMNKNHEANIGDMDDLEDAIKAWATRND